MKWGKTFAPHFKKKKNNNKRCHSQEGQSKKKKILRLLKTCKDGHGCGHPLRDFLMYQKGVINIIRITIKYIFILYAFDIIY